MENDQVLISNAEMWLLATGVAVIAVTVVLLSTRHAWSRVEQLPSIVANRLEPFDLVTAIIAAYILPAFVMKIVLLAAPIDVTPPGPTSAPIAEAVTTQTSQPIEDEALAVLSPWNVAASTVGQIVTMVLLLLIGANRFEGGLAGWGLRLRDSIRRAWQALVIFVGIWPLCCGTLFATLLVLKYLVPDYLPPKHSTIRILSEGKMPAWALATTACVAIILAPVCEECFFRGLLLPLIAKITRSTRIAVVLSGVLFGMIHFSVPHTMPALTVFGIVLGYTYARTRSLTLVILLHAVFNAKTLLWLWWATDTVNRL